MTDFTFPNIEGYGTPATGAMLYRFACEAPEGLIVELGTYKGQGAACLAQSGRTVLTIDHYEGETALGTSARPDHISGLYEADARRNLERYPNVIRAVGKTGWGARAKVGGYIDGYVPMCVALLVVDAAHDEESVTMDLMSWLPRVVAGGLVLLDDWTSHPGVKAAAARMLDKRGSGFESCGIQAGRYALYKRKEPKDAQTAQ